MSCIEHAIDMISRSIPELVLQKAFPTQGFATHTLRDRIREQTIRDRVIVDSDIVGGEVIYLAVLAGESMNFNTNEIAVFYSDSYLGGREIMSAHSYYATLGRESLYMPGVAGTTANNSQVSTDCSPCAPKPFCNNSMNSTLKSAQQMAMASLTGVTDPVNTSVTMIAKNTILLRYTNNVFGGAFKVVVSNDPYLNNIQPRSWQAFGEMCVLAAKSYVYNRTIISLGRTKILEGVESTALTSIIDSYSTAEEEYLLYLRGRWAKTSFMNDTNKWSAHVRSMFSYS